MEHMMQQMMEHLLVSQEAHLERKIAKEEVFLK
jgi:hypothetical protein